MYEALQLHARIRASDNETVILYALLAKAGRAGAGGLWARHAWHMTKGLHQKAQQQSSPSLQQRPGLMLSRVRMVRRTVHTIISEQSDAASPMSAASDMHGMLSVEASSCASA